MNILGVHVGHDSSACLLKNGKIIADVAEERFNRIKHYSGLPIQSVEYCLKYGRINIQDIDIIAVPSSSSMPELNYLFDLRGDQKEKYTSKRRMVEFANRIMNKPAPKMPLYMTNFPIKISTQIIHVDHHLAHCASAYYTSGSKNKQLIITMDGAGDGYSIGLWCGDNGKIELLKKFNTSASLGWFYGNVTEALGWWHGDGEGKTMGLAPYGSADKAHGVLDELYPKFENGDIIEPYDFGRCYFWNHMGTFQWHFDDAIKIKKLINKYGRENIAAEAQHILEYQTAEIIYPWLEKIKTKNLSCAGGIFLNVKLNQRVWESGKIERHHIYPNAGDSGLAVGAALYAYYKVNPDAPLSAVEDVYLGPDYSEKEIEDILKLRRLKYQHVEDVEKYVAQKLSENKIVAWFQGRMESGPRALGNRSILMSANKAENKDIINARVKFREAFRPFCPSLLWEKKDEYLENARNELFMITSFTCRAEKHSKVPAVVHVDGTLRPQMVKKKTNPRYWKVINEFGKLTGEYLLLNTSFNIMGEPIINRPNEAIRCFYDNGIDCLVMGNFVMEK